MFPRMNPVPTTVFFFFLSHKTRHYFYWLSGFQYSFLNYCLCYRSEKQSCLGEILILISVQGGNGIFGGPKWRWGAPCCQIATRGLDQKTLVFGLHCPLVARLIFDSQGGLFLGYTPEPSSKTVDTPVAVNFRGTSYAGQDTMEVIQEEKGLNSASRALLLASDLSLENTYPLDFFSFIHYLQQAFKEHLLCSRYHNGCWG